MVSEGKLVVIIFYKNGVKKRYSNHRRQHLPISLFAYSDIKPENQVYVVAVILKRSMFPDVFMRFFVHKWKVSMPYMVVLIFGHLLLQ